MKTEDIEAIRTRHWRYAIGRADNAEALASYLADAPVLLARLTSALAAAEARAPGRRATAEQLPPDGQYVAVWAYPDEPPAISYYDHGGECWVGNGTWAPRRAYAQWQFLAL